MKKVSAMIAVVALAVTAAGVQAATISDVMYMQSVSTEKGYIVQAGSSTTTVVPNTGTFSWQIMFGYKDSKSTVAVLPFLMPDLGVGGSFTSADLQVSPKYKTDPAPNFNVELYGLNHATDTLTVTTADHYIAGDDPGNHLLQDAFVTPATATYQNAVLHTDNAGDAQLLAWLNAIYDNGNNAGKYVYLRLSPDLTTTPGGSLSGYFQILTSSNDSATVPLRIAYTAETVPEPASVALMLGGMALLIKCRPRK